MKLLQDMILSLIHISEPTRPNNISLIDVLSEMAAKSNSEIAFISTDTEEGAQLAYGFGGLAAILRYPMM